MANELDVKAMSDEDLEIGRVERSRARDKLHDEMIAICAEQARRDTKAKIAKHLGVLPEDQRKALLEEMAAQKAVTT